MQSVKAIFQTHNNHVLDVIDNESHRIFIDREASVLFVAHLDTIHPPKIRRAYKHILFAQGLDDRLGCMLAYTLSKELGVDLLITDHEERCATTAAYHDCKDYNWIVQFDREGIDVVTYGLDNSEFHQALSQLWTIGIGSYSDICDLKTDACCFNLGIGGYRSHQKTALVDMRETASQIDLFRQFYADNKDIRYTRDTTGQFDSPYEDYIFGVPDDLCELCGCNNAITVFDYAICQDCFETAIEEHLYT